MTTQDFFQLFVYPANWNANLNMVFIIIGCVYLYVLGPIHRKYFPKEKLGRNYKIYFMTALILYYFALGSPLNLISHELFSMHMLQMSLLYFIVPPLLVLGVPPFILEFLTKGVMGKIINFCTKPLITLFFFNGLMSIYHVPFIFDHIMDSYLLHVVSHSLLMFASVCMWWPIIRPLDKEGDKHFQRIGLIFANGVLLTPACAIITFTDQVLFTKYMEISRLTPILSPIHDQQLGGVIMKITQELVYITAIAFVFLGWIKKQKKQDQVDLNNWDNLGRKDEESDNSKQLATNTANTNFM